MRHGGGGREHGIPPVLDHCPHPPSTFAKPPSNFPSPPDRMARDTWLILAVVRFTSWRLVPTCSQRFPVSANPLDVWGSANSPTFLTSIQSATQAIIARSCGVTTRGWSLFQIAPTTASPKYHPRPAIESCHYERSEAISQYCT